MPCYVLCLHCDLVDSWVFIAMLDGFICHSQVLINGSNPITKVHLVPGTGGVTLVRRKDDTQHIQTESNKVEGPTRKHAPSYLFLVDNKCDVITRPHSQHLPFDTDSQSSRGQQRAAMLFNTLLLV